MKVVLKCAPSLDGYIAHNDHDNVTWTSAEDKAEFIRYREEVGAVIMGFNTWKMYGEKPIANCFCVVLTSEPTADQESVIFRTDPAQIVKELEEKGYKEAALIGGGGANATFLDAGLLDEMYVTVTPHWFGVGVSMFAGNPSFDMELLDSRPLGPNETLQHYRVVK